MSKRIRTTYQAKRIRAAIKGGEILSFLGVSTFSPAYEAAIADLPDNLKRAHYKGSARDLRKQAAYYAESAPNMAFAMGVCAAWNANLAI